MENGMEVSLVVIAQIASVLVSAGTGLVLLVSARINFKIAKNATRARREQNYFQASNLMMKYWDDIQHIHSLNNKKIHYEDWEPKDRAIAARVCLCLHQIGGLMGSGAVPESICELYFYSIPKVYHTLKPYLESVRKEGKDFRHQSYWFELEPLVEKALQLNKSKGRDFGDIELLKVG
ncbi:hypothetical protein [Aliiglaciecola sp. M165]|uniref:hypothetical protein n=1 Tax=Aliiglaciecola sp. M165 TaxID=2593649 RepID=UPI00117EA572|nr:hypothetical protein [Aliiglaciecola sp. M165]TRY29797.1 hypothetical protein FM019_16635 [Aliiglaciecola sp. M165]